MNGPCQMNRHPLRWKVVYNLAGDGWIHNTPSPYASDSAIWNIMSLCFHYTTALGMWQFINGKDAAQKTRFSVPRTSLLFLCTRYDNRQKYWGMFVLWFYLSKTCKTKTARMLESNMYCTLQSNILPLFHFTSKKFNNFLILILF